MPKITCRTCRIHITIPETYARRRRIACPGCRTSVVVPQRLTPEQADELAAEILCDPSAPRTTPAWITAKSQTTPATEPPVIHADIIPAARSTQELSVLISPVVIVPTMAFLFAFGVWISSVTTEPTPPSPAPVAEVCRDYVVAEPNRPLVPANPNAALEEEIRKLRIIQESERDDRLRREKQEKDRAELQAVMDRIDRQTATDRHNALAPLRGEGKKVYFK